MAIDRPPLGIAPPAEALPWYQVWIKALTEPRVASYESLVTRPGVGLGRACLWVGLAGLISVVISTAAFVAFGTLDAAFQQTGDGLGDLSGAGLFFACLAGLFAIPRLLVSAGISHVLARALGGTGTYDQLAYGMAAYSAPGSLVSSAISFIPCLGILVALPLSLYLIFLNILTIKAVHHLSWGRAVLSSVLWIALVLVLIACLTIVILALLGPAIGNVFSNIVTEI